MADEQTTPPPTEPGADDALKKTAYERDQAKAQALKFQRELDEIKRALPSDEQRQRWAELEKQAETAEEERKRKAGEFDSLRQQLVEKHEREKKALLDERTKAAERADQERQRRRSGDIAREFAAASDLFGPSGKTKYWAEEAIKVLGDYVTIQDDGDREIVVVKDANGAVIVDPKTGAPMPFAKAMSELIDALPERERILRGSGKVGSGSPGGSSGSNGQLDLTRLKPADFRNPKVAEALRQRHADAGGLVIGPAFDRRAK